MDFATRAISERVLLEKNSALFRYSYLTGIRLKPYFAPPNRPRRYDELTNYEKNQLYEKAHKKLINKRSPLLTFFCLGAPPLRERVVTPAALSLIDYLIQKGTSTADIFRKEGIRTVYRMLAERLAGNEEFSFEDHPVLDLASALKMYIRDIMNGLFDYEIVKTVLKSIERGDDPEAVNNCYLLIFSLNDSQRECLIKLRELFVAVAANYKNNKINWTSIANILSLTLTPQEAFKKIEDVSTSVKFFNTLMSIDFTSVHVSRFL